MDNYKLEKTFQQRCDESAKMRSRYPSRVCIFLSKAKGCKLPDVDKNKFLVPGDMTMGQFIHVIRKRAEIHSSQGIFIFTSNNQAPPSTMSLNDVYRENKDADGFLYLTFDTELVYG